MFKYIISIHCGSFQADICMNRLCDMTISNIRKLFKLIRRWDFDNRPVIDRLTVYLEQAIQESDDAWKLASREFADGWRKVDRPKSRCPRVVEALENNKRLTRKVKTAKAQHDRWVKIQSIWADITQ